MPKPLSIAVDGPAGTGKSTVARLVAEKLGLIYVDTGAMYRAVAWKSLQENIPLSDEEAITAMTERMAIRFERVNGQRILADGTDVSEAIRTPEVSRLSSPVSAIPGVRKRLVEMQQQMGANGGVVMEGRDIGTVVLPNADVKIFLTASAEVRAERRYKEMRARGYEVNLQDILAEIRERDERDSTRTIGPLKQADDAVLINTDSLTIEQVVQTILDIARRKES